MVAASADRLRWHGGQYGECFHIDVGPQKFYIQDIRLDRDCYVYALFLKDSRKEKVVQFHPPEEYQKERKSHPWMPSWTMRIYRRWDAWKMRTKHIPWGPGGDQFGDGYWAFVNNSGDRTLFIVENKEQMIFRHHQQLTGTFDTIRECKEAAESIVRKAMADYEAEQNSRQITFDDLLAAGGREPC